MTSPLKSRWCGWLLACLLFSGHPIEGAGIEEQLKLARKADDSNAEIELLRRHLDAVPADGAARERLIRLWLDEGDFLMAKATLEEWKNPPAVLVVLVKAKSLAVNPEGKTEAISLLQAYLQQTPLDSEVLALLSQYLMTSQRWSERLAVLDQRVKLEPSASIYLDRALTHRELKHYPSAIQDARKASGMLPEGDSLRQAVVPYERLASALPIIEQTSALIEKNPADATARLRRGMALQFSNVSSLALADADAAAKAFPDSVTVHLLQVLNTPSEGWNDESGVNRSAPPISPQAAEVLIQADIQLAGNPKDFAIRLERARWLRNSQQPRLALRDTDAILAVDPDNGAALLETLYANAAIQQPDEAAAYFRRLERAKVSDAELAEALEVVVRTFFKNYHYSQTLEFANRALALKETDAMLNFKLQALQRLGRSDEAQAVEARIQRLKAEKKS